MGLTSIQVRLKVRTADLARQSNGANSSAKSNREFRDADHLFLALVTYVGVKVVMRITELGFENCHLLCALYDYKCHRLHPAGGAPGEMPISDGGKITRTFSSTPIHRCYFSMRCRNNRQGI